MNAVIDVAVGFLCLGLYVWLYQQSPPMAFGMLAFVVGNISMKVHRIASSVA